MNKVTLKINGKSVSVPENYTVLEAAKEINISIPTLCYLKDLNEQGCCRMCVVEVKGARALQAACVYPVSEGLEINTQSPVVQESRKVTLELLLSNHAKKCLTCVRNTSACELQTLAHQLKISDIRFEGEISGQPLELIGEIVQRDPSKCVLCRRCVSVCKNVQTVGVIETVGRGFKSDIGTAFDLPLSQTPCVNCGQCVTVCPTGALTIIDETAKIFAAIADPDKHVVVQTAPAVRAALGEEFGMPIGTSVTGKMVTALKMLGFDRVFDTNTAADLTIMEEGTELIGRIKNGGKLPLITSCSPGWIKFCEHNFPDLLDNLSTCKSPHMMFGAVIKSYYAEKMNIDPSKIVVVSIMPCTAKKFEVGRPEMNATGFPDVDYSLTTRGLARMLRLEGIEFNKLDDSTFDDPFGGASGAGLIFGATGGVMEAALRTVADILGESPSDKLDYDEVRGVEGIKEVSLKLGDLTVKAAVAHGLGNARKLAERIQAGEEFHFVEIMGCPGGCVTGGGQPIQTSQVRNSMDLKAERAKAIYNEDRKMHLRKSHKNQSIKRLYDEYLGEPNGHKAHQLLHTHYEKRNNY